LALNQRQLQAVSDSPQMSAQKIGCLLLVKFIKHNHQTENRLLVESHCQLVNGLTKF